MISANVNNTASAPRLLLLTALLVVLAFSVNHASPTDAGGGVIQGDVNCSQNVDSIDSLQILRSTAGLPAAANCLAESGDVNCSTNIDAVDALQILRHVAGLGVNAAAGCTPIGDPLEQEIAATSESLIAEALDAGHITYEESLLYRAYAIFADPKLPDEYASPAIDWEAGSELFGEIDDHEGELSGQLLADLAPYRVRPNDPQSVLFDTPEAAGSAAQGLDREWRTSLVPGTNARVWALGPVGAEEKYVDLVSTVWTSMLGVFIYPNSDAPGDPNSVVNPDGAIDFYFVNAGVDPRVAACEANPNQAGCLQANYGIARRAAPRVGNTSSGYLLVNAGLIGGNPLADDNLLDTVAHELTHVSQYAYDTGEASWLYESTATWVAYRIMKDLGRVPKYAYNRATELYDDLDRPLDREAKGDNDKYGAWLFFQHAAMDRGDQIVSQVWDEAATPGKQGIHAVDAVFPLDDNFDTFTVRNWNDEPVPAQYKDAPDNTFPTTLHPDLSRNMNLPGEADQTLDIPVEKLSAIYYRYTFGLAVRHIIVENNLVQTDGAHVWLLKKIAGDWKPPEDMEGNPVDTFCRDSEEDQDLEELIVIVSNSLIDGPTLNHNYPRVIADKIACAPVLGYASTTLRVTTDVDDITYTSGVVNLQFDPIPIQDQPGDIQYVLSAKSQGVHWVGSGTHDGCPAEGETTVLFPGVPYTGPENAAGYLVVVAPGDNHSTIITAYNPAATLTVTCPGDPPTITHIGFDAGFLLHILGWPNSDGGTRYTGDCVQDFGEHLNYHFTWDLRASDVLAPLSDTQPAATVPECFHIPTFP